MLINLRNALMTGKRLPYDAELEYLESTGTQYIDTGVVNAVDVDISCNFSCNASGTASRAIFGAYGGNSSKQRMVSTYSGWNTTTAHIAVYLGGVSFVYVTNNDINNITIAGDKCYFNESEIYSATNFAGSELTLWLFASNNVVSTYYPFTGRIYSCKIWKNGFLVLDLIPVRVGSGASAVGYMYDRVSKRLFGNAGSGAFVLGPDKAVPILSLHRYASPSNGTALGKMGVGANLVFNEEDYIMTTQLTITENCTNMATATTHIQTLLNASGIDADAIGFIKLHSESPRNNALLAVSFMMRKIPSGVQSRLRLRGGDIQLVNADSGYDADVQVGDVYDVYVLKKTEGWEQ